MDAQPFKAVTVSPAVANKDRRLLSVLCISRLVPQHKEIWGCEHPNGAFGN